MAIMVMAMITATQMVLLAGLSFGSLMASGDGAGSC